MHAARPKPVARRRRQPLERKREPLGREAWLNAAREALIQEGTLGVEINKLAKRLGVSRGGFYWFFKSRDHLLDELLAYWEHTSSDLFESVLRTQGPNGMNEFLMLVDLWVEEKSYDPLWDAAVRDWARTSKKVAGAVHRSDEKRITILQRIFEDMGYKGTEALVRARVTYYHQVGYYAMGVQETQKERRRLLPYFLHVLTGRLPD